MPQIYSIHSYRGGTGKSNVTANLATILAMEGYRVGIVDADIQSPGIHVLFGLDEQNMEYSFNDYLWGLCSISDMYYKVTDNLDAEIAGEIFLIPSKLSAGDVSHILKEGYDVSLLDTGIQELIDELALDILLIDTHPGLNEETLFSIAVSDKVILILRPDTQDFLGTNVTVEVIRNLGIEELLIVVNKIPKIFDFNQIRESVEKQFDCEVAVMLPHSDEMMMLGSSSIFVLNNSESEITKKLNILASKMMD